MKKCIIGGLLILELVGCGSSSTDKEAAALTDSINAINYQIEANRKFAWSDIIQKGSPKYSDPLPKGTTEFCDPEDDLIAYDVRVDGYTVFVAAYLSGSAYPYKSVEGLLLDSNVIATIGENGYEQIYRYINNKFYAPNISGDFKVYINCLNQDSLLQAHIQMYKEAYSSMKGPFKTSHPLTSGTMYFSDKERQWKYEVHVNRSVDSFDHMILIKKYPGGSNSDYTDKTKAIEVKEGVILQLVGAVIATKNDENEWVQFYRYQDDQLILNGPEGSESFFKKETVKD